VLKKSITSKPRLEKNVFFTLKWLEKDLAGWLFFSERRGHPVIKLENQNIYHLKSIYMYGFSTKTSLIAVSEIL